MNERVESLAASEGRLFVLLKVRGESFALPSDQVRGVTRVGRVTRIFHAPRGFRGVANWRGKVLTLYDLGEGLGLPGERTPMPFAVVLSVEDANVDVAILADHVTEVRAIPEELLESFASRGDLNRGVIDLDGQPVMVLDSRLLLRRLAMGVLSPALSE